MNELLIKNLEIYDDFEQDAIKHMGKLIKAEKLEDAVLSLMILNEYRKSKSRTELTVGDILFIHADVFIENGDKYEKLKHVYVMKNDLGDVKIGVSANVNSRKSSIETSSGHKITDVYATPPCSNAFEIENLCHKHFSNNNIGGEWFNVEFDKAVEVVEKTFTDLATLKKKTDSSADIECLKKILLTTVCANSSLEYVLKLNVASWLEELCNYIETHEELSLSKKRSVNPYWNKKEIEIMLLHSVFEYASMLDTERIFPTKSEMLVQYENAEIFTESIELMIDGEPYYSDGAKRNEGHTND